VSELSESNDHSLRLVIDAVGFVRALINPRSIWGAIAFIHTDGYILVMSDELEREIRDVLGRPGITRKFDEFSEALMVVLNTTIHEAERVERGEIPNVCRDPNDDKILATAVVGKADLIATEDKDLLDMIEYEGIRIVTGFELLTILRAND
jgi:putative PIN family toxin of toxin-antitoxin system